MGLKTGKERKVRSDKKQAIAPYIEDEHRVWVQRIAGFTGIPEGDTGIALVEASIYDQQCVDFFKSYYRRSFVFAGKVIMGDWENRSIDEYLVIKGARTRFKMRAKQPLARRLQDFQIALGTPYLAHATHALLRYALHDMTIIRKVAARIQAADVYDTLRPTIALPERSKAFSILK